MRWTFLSLSYFPLGCRGGHFLSTLSSRTAALADALRDLLLLFLPPASSRLSRCCRCLSSFSGFYRLANFVVRTPLPAVAALFGEGGRIQSNNLVATRQ